MISLKNIRERANALGIDIDDTDLTRSAKNLMVYLAMLMSFGGLIWGSLLLYFNLPVAAIIPYGYLILSVINVSYFSLSRNFTLAKTIQLAASMALPFLLQWELGGFFNSGCVMLWSALSLVGSIILLRGSVMYSYLALFFVFVAISYWLDPYFAATKPFALTHEISLGLSMLNVLLIGATGFVLVKLKIDGDFSLQEKLERLHLMHEKNMEAEREVYKQLAASENRYRNLVEESKVLICTHDLLGNLLSVNKPGSEILGYKPDELIGRNLAELAAPDFLGNIQFYLDHIAKHKTFESFMSVISKQGEKRVFLFKNTLIEEEDREPYVLGSAQDVTEWRNSEYREISIRKELQLIVSSMDDFVVEFDHKACFKNIWCRDDRRLFMPVSYFIGKTISQVFANLPEFAVEAQRIYNRTLETGEPYSAEIEDMISKDTLYYLVRLNPIRERDGRALRCAMLVTDITKRKQAENKLTEAFQTQNVLIENLDGGVLIEDGDRKIRLVNEEFCRLFNIPVAPKNLIGADCNQSAEQVRHLFVNADFPERVREIIEAKIRILNEELYMVDGRVLERDYIPIAINNHYQGHLWHYRDITKRKQFELALKAAKEEAEESNRLKTIFLGNLSHEVRTPLQGILGFAEILENPRLAEPKRKEYLNIIKRRTADMQNIIESLLDMASLETGEIKSFPIEVNLSETIEYVFNKVKQDHDLSGRSLQLLFKNMLPEKCMALIDPQHLHQVLTNLVGNAIKFTSTGLVVLSCEQIASTYRVSIVDTGMGISADKIDRIFEPFRQAHEGISRSKGGIGLGLAICKKMVEMWRGEISVVSQPGQGSTFSFTIPEKK